MELFTRDDIEQIVYRL